MPFKVEVIADNSGRWCGNGLVFATRQEGEQYARDLANRWLLVRDWRVVDAAEVNLTVMIGPITRVYRALCTTAPTEYDRGTSITLLTGPAGSIEGLLSGGLLSNDKQVAARVVLIEDSHFEWHRARYSSGLYANAEPDPDLFGPSEIAAELLRRLDRGTPTQL